MPASRSVLPLMCCLLLGSCSNVKVAMYNSDARQAYALEERSSYLKSSSGKIFSFRKSIVDTADDYLGAPYRYGGTDAKKGFDCSGLVFIVAQNNELELPRSSSSMASAAP